MAYLRNIGDVLLSLKDIDNVSTLFEIFDRNKNYFSRGFKTLTRSKDMRLLASVKAKGCLFLFPWMLLVQVINYIN